jgi:translation initiation factor IF-2
MGFSDRDEIEDIVRMSAKNGHGVRNLLHLVIASRIFQEK